MNIPDAPSVSQIGSISPSFYNTALLCKAKAAWMQFGDRTVLPSATGAILGTCFHAVMQMANGGRLPPGADGEQLAKETFDRKATTLFGEAHPLVRAKFRHVERIPYYYQRRARAVAIAAKSPSVFRNVATHDADHASFPPDSQKRVGGKKWVERKFSSKDGAIAGRIDLLDGEAGKIIDYKSGFAPAGALLSDTEIQQLRLYGYLALENDLPVSCGQIMRADGSLTTIELFEPDVINAGAAARKMLSDFNQAIEAGASFDTLASAQAPRCEGCPCIPFCKSFWTSANPEWELSVGTNAEGTILESHPSSSPEAALLTLTIECKRGSAPRGRLVVEQIPYSWLTFGSSIPMVGDTVRIVQAFRFPDGSGVASQTLRVDRLKSTTIWLVPADSQSRS